MKRIVFEQAGQSNIQIVSPVTDDDATLAFVIEQSVKPNTDKWFVVDDADIPSDRYFRNAWKISNGKVSVDIEKAKSIKLQEIRLKRNSALDASDKEIAKLTDQGADLTEMRAKRQALRDIPQTIKLDGLTPEELKSLDPING